MNVDSELNLENELFKKNYLPRGRALEETDSSGEVWPNLEARFNVPPRVESHPFLKEVVDSMKRMQQSSGKLKSFEAGCGFGIDLRKFREICVENGINIQALGVDYFEREIHLGLEHFGDFSEMQEALAKGDLRDLRKINLYNPESSNFSKEGKIDDATQDVIYFEAILHAFGGGYDNYEDKKANAQKMLNELGRIAKPGAILFGRASVWGPDDEGVELSEEEQFAHLRNHHEWRFIPGSKEEFIKMLGEAGFESVNTQVVIREGEKRERRKNWPRVAFMCRRKLESKE